MIGKTVRISAIATVLLFATVSVVSYVFAEEDSDNDGLPDWWELQYFGDLSHGPNVDSDSDGFTDQEEFSSGTDPTDPNDKPKPPGSDK